MQNAKGYCIPRVRKNTQFWHRENLGAHPVLYLKSLEILAAPGLAVILGRFRRWHDPKVGAMGQNASWGRWRGQNRRCLPGASDPGQRGVIAIAVPARS